MADLGIVKSKKPSTHKLDTQMIMPGPKTPSASSLACPSLCRHTIGQPPPHSCLGQSQPVYRLALQGLQDALHKELTVRGDFLQALDRGQGQKGDDWNAKGGIARMKKLMLHNFTITGALFFWCASDEISIMFI